MGQLGFFDADRRLATLSDKGDPLEAIDRLVPWESFRTDIEAVVLTPDEARKSRIPIWHHGITRPEGCPVCGHQGDIPLLLSINSMSHSVRRSHSLIVLIAEPISAGIRPSTI